MFCQNTPVHIVFFVGQALAQMKVRIMKLYRCPVAVSFFFFMIVILNISEDLPIFCILLAHLAQRAKVNYCHTNVSGVHCVVCVVWRLQQLKTIIQTSSFYEATGPTALKFHMEHDLTPGSQNCKIGSGQIYKLAAITENSKNNKINLFSRTTENFLAEIWHEISMGHRYSKL